MQNKHDLYRGKDCMKTFCESLGEYIMKIINFKKKQIKSLTKELQESYENAKICYICKKKFKGKYTEDMKYHQVSGHCYYTGAYRGAAHSICNLTLFRMGIFGAAYGWGEGQKGPPP